MTFGSKLPRHGSSRGYNTYKCRCDECKAWRAEEGRQELERKKSRPVPDHVHGTTNGYSNYGCRCEDCTHAKSAASRQLYHRNRDAARSVNSGEAS